MKNKTIVHANQRVIFLFLSIFLSNFLTGQPDSLLSMQNTEPLIETDFINLSFVGSGNFQRTLLDDAPMGAHAGIGMIFLRKWKKPKSISNLKLDLHINVAASADSLIVSFNQTKIENRKEFGRYLLQPFNSQQASNFNLQLYFNPKKNRLLTSWLHGVSMKFYASNTSWQYLEQDIDLSGIAFRAGIFHDFIPEKIRNEKSYSIMLGVDYSFRGLFGDLSSTENEPIRLAVLGTNQTIFHGFEFHFGFQLKNIRAEVVIPVFKNKNAEVPGLTNTQFITALKFVGGFPVHLSSSRN